MLSSVNLLCCFGFSPQFSRSRSNSSAAPFAKPRLRCSVHAAHAASVQPLSQHQFSRAIRKVAPSVLSRCFAANFAHKPALSPCISTSTKMCKHILCCLCLCMAELLQKDYILKRFCLQSHILIIDLLIFNQYNREGKRRRIEAVITGRTRNALALRGTRVRIPPSPLFIFLFHRKESKKALSFSLPSPQPVPAKMPLQASLSQMALQKDTLSQSLQDRS